MEHGAVADACPGGDIRSVQNRSDLLHAQVADERLVMALGGDGEDLPGLVQRGRIAELDVAHEGFHCRQAGVAGSGCDAALHLDVAQESEDELGVELFKAKP